MRDRNTHRALAKIVTIREAERTAARHELFVAGEREREALAASRRADQRVQAAASAWQEHLAGGFMPEFAGAFAGELVERAEAGTVARDHAARMADAREEREAEWCRGDARLRQAEASLKASGRALARHRDERALETIADRVTFEWTRA